MALAPWLTSKTPIASTPPPWAPEPRISEDIQITLVRALRTGVEVIPAGPGETSSLAPALVRKVIQYMVDKGIVDPNTMQEFEQGYEMTGAGALPGLSTVRENITDPLLGPGQDVPAQTGLGKFAKVAIEEAPSSLFNPGGTISKIVQWLASSVGSEGAGQLAEQYADQLPSWAPTAARVAGGGAGALAPQTFNRLSSPNPIPPFRQPQIDVLKSRNVPLSAGQITGSKKLMMKEDVAGGTPAHEAQPEAFTTAALETQGGFPPGTPRAERKVMKKELDRMGAEFDRMEAISAAPFDQSLQDDLLDTVQTYIEENPHVAPVVENTMNDLARNAAANGGILTGEAYQSIRTRINKLVGQESTEPGVVGALMDMKDKLDEAIEQSLPSNEQSAWRTVRAQYRNYLPIERAKAAQGQGAAEGVINPKQLKTGIKAIEGKREIASGDRPMTELAEAGEAVMEKPPSSGTAERAKNQLAQLIALAGGGVGASLGQALESGPATAILATLGAAGGIGYPMLRDALSAPKVARNFLPDKGRGSIPAPRRLCRMCAFRPARRSRGKWAIQLYRYCNR